MKSKNFPLMKNNIIREDLDKVIEYLQTDDPRLTNGPMVKKFEEEWSNWLGVKYSVFVNSGSSANLISLSILKEKFPNGGNIIVPAFTWISDIASILQTGFQPNFVDIDLDTLGLDIDKTIDAINESTRAVFITHAQGFNALSSKLLNCLKKNNIYLIEDVCESHGASYNNKKCGSYGLMSNFSFYYAHHMSTIEGGMVCTNDYNIYQQARMFRSHGLLRESSDQDFVQRVINNNPELNPEFVFMFPAYNMRNNEINALIGLNQLQRLNNNVKKRNDNQAIFYNLLNSNKFKTTFIFEGSSNYAFNVILNQKDDKLMQSLCDKLTKNGIEFRRGSAGGGNQLRQPYLRLYRDKHNFETLKNTDHMHYFSLYLGNYPELTEEEINYIVNIINSA